MNILVNTIKEHTIAMFHNARTAIKTCDIDYALFDVPLWKHIYHMLHSCDQWFINPVRYEHPSFHVDGLNSIDEKPGGYVLSREELLRYLGDIEKKTLDYLDCLTDEMLYENPEGCSTNRLSCALGAFRHLYAHLGNINCTTIIETGKWPRVAGMQWLLSHGDDLWE
jgi:hypothetical protein